MNIFACGIQNKTFIKIYSAHKITCSNPVWKKKKLKSTPHDGFKSNDTGAFLAFLITFLKIHYE